MCSRLFASILVAAVFGGCSILPAGTPEVDPHIEISVSARKVQVGDTLTVVGVPVDFGLPYYRLHVDSGTLVTATYEGEVKYGEAQSQIFEVTSVSAEMSQVEFTLTALRPGSVKISISAEFNE